MVFPERARLKKNIKEYLQRTHRANIMAGSQSEEERKRVDVELSETLTHDAWKQSGHLEFTLGPNDSARVRIEYDDQIEDDLLNLVVTNNDPFSAPVVDIAPTRSLRRITSLRIDDGLHVFDLGSARHGHAVYAYIHDGRAAESVLKKRGHVVFKSIIIYDDIRSLQGITTLLHELGHILADAASESRNADTSWRSSIASFGIRGKRAAERIREERRASAYALKTLRPFVDVETLNKIRQTLHDSLRHYHTLLRTGDA